MELLTEKELQQKLKCSGPAIRVWRRQGMPFIRLGRLVRFEFESVLNWFIKRQEQGEK